MHSILTIYVVPDNLKSLVRDLFDIAATNVCKVGSKYRDMPYKVLCVL